MWIYTHATPPPPMRLHFSYLYRKIPTKNTLSWAGGHLSNFPTFHFSNFPIFLGLTFQFSNFSGPNFPFFQFSNFPIFLGLTFQFSNFSGPNFGMLESWKVRPRKIGKLEKWEVRPRKIGKLEKWKVRPRKIGKLEKWKVRPRKIGKLEKWKVRPRKIRRLCSRKFYMQKAAPQTYECGAQASPKNNYTNVRVQCSSFSGRRKCISLIQIELPTLMRALELI